jgi:GT2 family glycosyltransferase
MLTWNSEKYLEDCINSIISKCQVEQIDYQIIVIDNGSNDRTLSILGHYCTKLPERIRIIKLERNRGTTYSRNLGFKAANSKYICVIDSDTELGVGSLREILDRLQKHAEIGIIAPRLILGNGSIQNSVKRFPTFWDKLIKVPAVILSAKVPTADFYQDFPFEGAREVDSAISACWIFKKELLETIGYLDENLFYSPEDLDYCLRVRKAGKQILYNPCMTVVHHTQQISHRKPFSKISLSHLTGLIYYYRKHGGWFSRPKCSVKEHECAKHTA